MTYALTEQESQIMELAVEAFQNVADGIIDAITGILPIALPVMGAIVVVGIGVKVFKRFVK